MSHYLLLLIITDAFTARLAMLPYGHDKNVSKLLTNLLQPVCIL